MSGDEQGRQSYLDRIRLGEGPERCRQVFIREHMNDSQRALELLSDRDLSFSCMYLLLPQIGSLQLLHQLDTRSYIAVGISEQVVGNRRIAGEGDFLSAKDEAIRSTLKWMLRSGSREYSPDMVYHRILDIAASLLIITYKDADILPDVCDLIFARKRMGRNTHNLTWAFFKAGDLEALRLTAEKLKSPDETEAAYAVELLGEEAQAGYDAFLELLKRSGPRFIFTGEDHQFSSKPVICVLDKRKPPESGIII